MGIRWNKLGHVFNVDGSNPSVVNYAAPLALLVLGDRYRVFFTSRTAMDREGKFTSRIFFTDVSREDPLRVIRFQSEPLLELGEPGSFDEFGTMVAKVVPIGASTVYMYYMGWQRGVSVPYFVNCGMAVSSDDGQSFRKLFSGPTLGVSKEDPFGIGNVAVLKDPDLWRLWYTSFTSWLPAPGKAKYSPQYCIKYATSLDGIGWTRTNMICIAPSYPGEAIATPCVLRIANRFHMWYSYRGGVDYHDGKDSYRIGYAISEDGLYWQRCDSYGGLEPSREGWDSTMTAYPALTIEGDQLIMFYNGNCFGRDGFGLATAQLESLGDAASLVGAGNQRRARS